MKKSSSTPRKIFDLGVKPVKVIRKNSSPEQFKFASNIEQIAEDPTGSKYKTQISTSRSVKKQLFSSPNKPTLPQSARISPKSDSSPLLHRSSKSNPYEIQQVRPKSLKNLIRIKKNPPKDRKPSKTYLREMLTQVNADVYNLPNKTLSGKEIKFRRQEIHRAHMCQTFHGLKIIEEIPKLDIKEISEKMIILPSIPPSKKTVIFDLDETLVHCIEGKSSENEVLVKFPTGESIKVGYI